MKYLLMDTNIFLDMIIDRKNNVSKEYNVHACQDTKLNFLVMNSFREFYAAA